MKIALTSVFVNNPIEAHRFYTEKLGFSTRMFVPEANLAIVVSPEDLAGTGLLLEPCDNPIAKQFQDTMYQEGRPAIVFGVEDVQGEYEKLLKRGVTFHYPPTRTDWGVQAVIDDTCGNFIAISQVSLSTGGNG
jgi:predicted enzyme related to lactoylglutathione lyase